MRALRVVIAVLVLLTGTLTASAVASGASAATTGAGISGITPSGGYLGNYLAPDGSRVYCIDSAREWPSGATGSGAVVSSLSTEWGAALTPQTLRKFDYALRRYGQTSEPVQAAALNAYLYAYTSAYARSHGAGVEAGLHYINGNRVVQGAFAGIWADVEAHATAPDPVAELSIALNTPMSGTVTVTSSVADAVGTLELDGAVLEATGERSGPVHAGDTVAIAGSPAEGAEDYRIAARVTLTVPSTSAPAVTLYTTGSQQRTIRDAGPSSIELSAEDEVGPIPLGFAPTIQSRVAEPAIEPGAPARDLLTAALLDTRPWPSIADVPVTIVAKGTLYGPFAARPDESATPIEGAPTVGLETLEFRGPGELASPGTLHPTAPGFYTWVWRIDAADQSPEVAALLPEAYAFADRFGLEAETFEVVAPELAQTGSTPVATPVGAGALGAIVLGVLLGNIRRRRAFRSV